MEARIKPTILLVDDDEAVLTSLVLFFGDDYNVLTSASGPLAIDLVQRQDHIATVVMDIKMPGMDGITAAREIRRLKPEVPVIFLTGYPGDYGEDDIRTRENPTDYILKGENPRRLAASVRGAVESFRVKYGNSSLDRLMAANHGIIGRSRAMHEVYLKILTVADSDKKVMLRGETGTGKDVVAQAIHDRSRRARQNMVVYHCSSKDSSLIDNELFGHKKGAFTSAHVDHAGRFEEANGSTLYLDEVGDIDVGNQGKLLRVLETGKVRRFGEERERDTDVRVICATHKNLEKMVENNEFRQDLYYRLSGVRIDLPPLRERKEDIPLLIETFNAKTAKSNNRQKKVFDPAALDVLVGYDWPGNVRQLKTFVSSVFLMTHSDLIVAEDCKKQLNEKTRLPAPVKKDESLGEVVRNSEKQIIEDALRQNDFNISAAARTLGVDRSNLRKKIKKLGIETRSNRPTDPE